MTKPSTASAPSPTPVPVGDERLANISLTARILRRPEIGALLAAGALAVGLSRRVSRPVTSLIWFMRRVG